MTRSLRKAILWISPFIVIGVVWDVLVSAGILDPFMVSRPTDVVRSLGDQLWGGPLSSALVPTLVNTVIAFTMVAVVGTVFGLLLGWYRVAESALEPLVWFLYSSPVIALYPVFVISLGLGSPTVIAIAFLLGVSPVVVNTMLGVRTLDPVLILAARAYGARDRDIFVQVALPGSVPSIMAGLRIAVGRVLTGVIVGEMFASDRGVGFLLGYYTQTSDTTQAFAVIAVIAILGLLASNGLRWAESTFDKWRVDPSAER